MKNHWRPDAAFFGKRNREQLVGIAKECGYAEGKGQLSSYKKADLVNSLIRHFQSAKGSTNATDSSRAEGAGMVAGGDAVSCGRSERARRSRD